MFKLFKLLYRVHKRRLLSIKTNLLIGRSDNHRKANIHIFNNESWQSLDLIRVHYNYVNDTNNKVAILKPTIDTRDGKHIKSRNGSHVPVTFSIKKEDRIMDMIRSFDFDVC